MRNTASFRTLLAILLAASLCTGQAKPAPTLADALGLLQANDFAGAAKALEQVTEREPNNGRAWRNLALARQNLKQWDGAIAANQRSLEIEPAIVTPIFALGVVYALKGDRDQAFAWLAKAKATHKIDMSQMEATPE